jgi:NADPH:quinone reductase-like Zn-dependent oxidoreductase
MLKLGRKIGVDRGGAEGFQPTRDDVQTLRPGSGLIARTSNECWRCSKKGAVQPTRITCCKLAEAAKAHETSEARHLQGKLVLVVRQLKGYARLAEL